MGKRYLIDTNILIYFLSGRYVSEILPVLEESFHVSIITKIELLGWNKHTDEGFLQTRSLIENASIIPLTDAIAEKAILLKRQSTVKLADSIIAATCLTEDFILVSRNEKEFTGITGLEFFNPIPV
ncbi:MAG: hypothetical protein A2Y33_14330 [Spirochaetes bacterium GWF1_51_8]|nr:MAG: hypothetical protein A2Y33_14330 [Spirochaetes bacterium GWF1_51_8]